jgi:endonuclease G, mitochondrial
MTNERLERVRSRLRSSPELAEAVREAIANREVPGTAAAEISQRAADAAASDRQPLESLVRIDVLEAIVQRIGRPPLLIRNDAVQLEPLVDFPAGTDALIMGVEPFIKSVGRVEFLNHAMTWGGTGWVVAAEGHTRVVATNRHVAKLVASRTPTGGGTFLRSPLSGVRYGMNLDFKEEVGSLAANARPFEVRDIVYLADDASPDVALLRIDGDDLPTPLPLAEEEAGADQVVAIIGYPAFDSRNDVDDQARYFHDLYDVKRFAPGKVMQVLSGRTTLRHDCTTLGGNSGSPLIRLEDRKVVGLHFAGVYGRENSAVGAVTMRELIRSGSRPIFGIVTIPRDGRGTEAAADGFHTADQLKGREGYDPHFLGTGFPAPWPGLTDQAVADLARPSDEIEDRPGELRYTHFSVRFSTARRLPLITAVNIDGRRLVAIKRSGDRWFADGRLPRNSQLTKADYDDPKIDRGHMVRRQDPNWDPLAARGAGSELAERANLDTFHYTNAAPQHSEMNQGKELWLGLEDYILENARTSGFKACVFTGPVNRNDDPEIKPGVLAPREFWKLVVMVNAERESLHATAYLLSQGDLIRELLEKRNRTEANEGFVFGPYRTFQIAVSDLADATGYDLSTYVDADPLAAAEPGREATDVPLFVPLERREDIRT